MTIRSTIYACALLSATPFVAFTQDQPRSQNLPARQTSSSVTASGGVPRAIPGIPVSAGDTGRMEHGWLEFARYDIGAGRSEMCTRAILNAKRNLWGVSRERQDTIPYPIRRRVGVPSEALTVGQRCGATALTAALDAVKRGTSHANFLSMMRLAVALQRDTIALQLLQQHLVHFHSVEEQAAIYTNALKVIVSEEPKRIALINATMHMLDSVGNNIPSMEIQWWRMRLHYEMSAHWMRMGDTGQVRTAIEATLHMVRSAPPAIRSMLMSGEYRGQIEAGFYVLVDLASLEHGGRSKEVLVVYDRMDHELGTPAGGSARTADNYAPMLMRYGSLWTPPKTEFWYPPPGQPGSGTGTVRQHGVIPGHVTLIVPALSTCTDASTRRHGLNVFWQRLCQARYVMLRRLMSVYGPQGLDLILVSKTQGFVPGWPAFAPADEAKKIREYFQDYYKLPATVIVQVTPYTQRPDPDGRRRYHITPYERNNGAGEADDVSGWGGAAGLGIFVLDRHGKILAIEPRWDLGHTSPDDTREPILELYIKQALHPATVEPSVETKIGRH